MWSDRLLPHLAALFAAVMVLATPLSAEAPQHQSLAGRLLVASPSMGDPRFERLLPATCAEAPPVARLETGEPELRLRCREVVADCGAEREELLGHHRADGVDAGVLAARPAAAVPPEAGHGVEPAWLERVAEHVPPFGAHSRIMPNP